MKISFLFIALLLTISAQKGYSQNFDAEMKAFDEMDFINAPPKNPIVFTGSSTIRLWSNLVSEFNPLPVLNRGFGGSEMADLVHYAPRVLYGYQPKVAVVYEGDNDLANGVTPEAILNGFQAVASELKVQSPGTKLVFISIKPSPARIKLLNKMRETNALVKHYIFQHPGLYYYDIFTPMLDAQGLPRPELFGPDKLHMNSAGYALWKQLLLPFIQKLNQ